MPRERRVIGPGGVRISNRTYDARALGPYRRQPFGTGPDGRLWEVHYDPYDISRVWVRNHREGGWITATWRHLRTSPVPMGELIFDRAHQVLAEREQRKPHKEAVARAAAELLDRATDDPGDRPARRQKGKRADDGAPARPPRAPRPPAPQPGPGPNRPDTRSRRRTKRSPASKRRRRRQSCRWSLPAREEAKRW
ncbi:Mu transposase C-terminal domain-containing protein [Streptomyces bauhiniae]